MFKKNKNLDQKTNQDLQNLKNEESLSDEELNLNEENDNFYDEISLKELFMSTMRIEEKKKHKIDLFWLEKFFKETSLEYKKTIGMLAVFNMYRNKFDISEEEEKEFIEIIILHKIGESKKLNTTPMPQLNAAIYALEQDKPEEFVLALMLHTDGQLKSTYEDSIVGRVYEGIEDLISEKAQKYIDYLTFLNLSTKEDGKLTTISDTIFKTLTSDDRDSVMYDVLHQNKHQYLKLSESIMSKNITD